MATKKQQNKTQAKQDTALSWTDNGWADYLHWQSEDQNIVGKINDLIDECRKTPFSGTGKPEPLTGSLTGFWSRRITDKHRLVYLPEDGQLYIVACRFHYTKAG